MIRWLLFLIPVLIIGHGCQTSTNPNNSDFLQFRNASNIFDDALTEFKVNVFYEVGAAPYDGNIGLTANQTWDITKSSYEALFQNHGARTVNVPSTLAQMTQFADQGRANWSAAQLLALGQQRSPALILSGQANVSIFFLNGTFEGNSDILGVQFSGSPFAFVFKDIVISAGGDPVSQRYAEQATVVHELGHVVGLVNHGVPMVTPHEDSAHPHHTANSTCVMYWAVESKSNILSSIANLILGNQLNLFGPESLQDGRAFHP